MFGWHRPQSEPRVVRSGGLLLPTPRDLPYSPLRELRDAVLNLLYPQDCLICGVPVARYQDRSICGQCWQSLLQLRLLPPWCPSCGVPLGSGLSEQPDTERKAGFVAAEPASLCLKCVLQAPPYAGARSFGYYTSELRQLIQSFKFKGRQDLACLLAPLLASVYLESWSERETDLIIPVPLHAKRKRERGFNQAALIGARTARLLGLDYCENALARVRSTPPQIGLRDAERRRNVRQAFKCTQPGLVRGRRLLLIDDVMTTGATIASATETLMQAGALRVSVLTVARTAPGVE